MNYSKHDAVVEIYNRLHFYYNGNIPARSRSNPWTPHLEVYLTGSFVIDKMGFNMNRKPTDLDFVLKGNPISSWSNLIKGAFPDHTVEDRGKKKGGYDENYIRMHYKGIKIDFLIAGRYSYEGGNYFHYYGVPILNFAKGIEWKIKLAYEKDIKKHQKDLPIMLKTMFGMSTYFVERALINFFGNPFMMLRSVLRRFNKHPKLNKQDKRKDILMLMMIFFLGTDDEKKFHQMAMSNEENMELFQTMKRGVYINFLKNQIKQLEEDE